MWVRVSASPIWGRPSSEVGGSWDAPLGPKQGQITDWCAIWSGDKGLGNLGEIGKMWEAWGVRDNSVKKKGF